MTEVMEGRIKVKIPETRNVWEPKKIGECLVGTYCHKEPVTFNGRKNTLYTVKTDNHPIRDIADCVKFYGTIVLNDVLGKIEPGYEVEIIYRGEQPMKDRKKKPMKLFEVNFWVDPNDPILQKIYPDGLPADLQKKIDEISDPSGAAGDDQESEMNTLNSRDNEEIQVFLDGVEEDLKDAGKNVTESNVWKLARKQAGDDKEFLADVKEEIRNREYNK
ncbi:hypothetical protein [Methanobacterium formicicum]|uniref:hypothetical protein n=1 Tax=Methanobacterium formicicum TaxID=2162 RepID=UPI002412DAE8|nr:hypothetical protein [Methanobacterium formicicum]MDG3546582.1 hypothetical protein [Methanobacterium formicicum]